MVLRMGQAPLVSVSGLVSALATPLVVFAYLIRGSNPSFMQVNHRNAAVNLAVTNSPTKQPPKILIHSQTGVQDGHTQPNSVSRSLCSKPIMSSAFLQVMSSRTSSAGLCQSGNPEVLLMTGYLLPWPGTLMKLFSRGRSQRNSHGESGQHDVHDAHVMKMVAILLSYNLLIHDVQHFQSPANNHG